MTAVILNTNGRASGRAPRRLRRKGYKRVVDTNENVQTAIMILPRDGESGPLGNEHPESTQVIAIVPQGGSAYG